MINQDLLTYIENEISRGTPKNIIQSNLLSNGWNEKDVAEGFSSIVVKNYNPTITPSSANININQQSVTQSVSSPLIKINLPDTSEPLISQPTTSNPVMLPSMLAQQNFLRMSASQTEPKKSNFGVIITVIIILLILAGGGFAYYKYLSGNNPLNQNVVMQNVTTTENPNNLNTVTGPTSQIVSTSSDEQNINNDLATSSDIVSNIVDCGVNGDIENLPKIKETTSNGITSTKTDYEKDKALVCFGTNLLSCNNAEIKFVSNDGNGTSTGSMNIVNKNGENCIVRLNIDQGVLAGKNYTNQFLECPFPIKDLPDITCPMGMCVKIGNPGSSGIGMLAAFSIGVQFQGVDDLKAGGCTTNF